MGRSKLFYSIICELVLGAAALVLLHIHFRTNEMKKVVQSL